MKDVAVSSLYKIAIQNRDRVPGLLPLIHREIESLYISGEGALNIKAIVYSLASLKGGGADPVVSNQSFENYLLV